MATVQEVVAAYIAAWNAVDGAAQQQALAVCWTPDGVLTGPYYELVGREALTAHLAGFHQRYQAPRVELSSGLDAHHDLVRYRWRIRLGDGALLAEGEDVGMLAADGRLARVLMFYDAPPA